MTREERTGTDEGLKGRNGGREDRNGSGKEGGKITERRIKKTQDRKRKEERKNYHWPTSLFKYSDFFWKGGAGRLATITQRAVDLIRRYASPRLCLGLNITRACYATFFNNKTSNVYLLERRSSCLPCKTVCSQLRHREPRWHSATV